ncbi:MAG TPA: hypothetical protein VHT53_05150 [Candidatus Elarobacter sp.]|jgi:hypothetical protein|nr:hypothetical protein [Candidatus Elarobacter sp.]
MTPGEPVNNDSDREEEFERDDDPTAGASDIGGRAGSPDDDDGDARGDDGHEPGGGHTGMGKGPTGS